MSIRSLGVASRIDRTRRRQDRLIDRLSMTDSPTILWVLLISPNPGSFPIRILCPPLFLLASLNYFLPQTAHNLSLYYQQIESAHLPPSVQAHRQAIVDRTRSLWKQGEESAKSGVKQVEGGVKGGLKKVEEQTGLKIGQKE